MAEIAAELIVGISAKDSVSAVLARLESQLDRTNSSVDKIAAGMGTKLSGAQAKARSDALLLAQAQARLQTASGDLIGAERTLSTALASTEKGTLATLRAEIQLAKLRGQLTAETEKTIRTNRSFAASLLQIAGPLGLATTGIGAFLAVAGRVKEGFALRATLDEQRRSVGILLGDVQKGDQVFRQAAEFGRQYGFTQKEMGESAAAAAPLIKNSTTAVSKQLEVLARLASVNTKEGFTGATFSTKELASGDITSIVERFNIARSAARQMKAEIAAGADVFAVLDAQLSKMGVTAEVLSNRTLGAAGATRTYAQAQEDLTLALGQFAEDPGVKILDFLAKYTNTITGIVGSGNPFAAQAQQAGEIEAKLIGAATSYADYGARVQQVNAQINESFAGDPISAAIARQIGGLGQLTPMQFAYAQSLIQTGTSAQQAVAQTQALSGVAENLALIQTGATRQSQEMGAAFAALAPQMLQAASAGPEFTASVEQLALAFVRNEIDANQLSAALTQMIAAQQANANAAQFGAGAYDANRQAALANASATRESNSALGEQTEETLQAAQKSQELAQFQSALADLAGQVSSGHLSNAQAAGVLARQYGIASGEATRLLQLQAALARAKTNAAALTDQRAGERDGGSRRTSSEIEFEAQQDRRAQASRLRRAQEAEAALKKARGGGGGGAKLSDQQRLNNSLLADQERYQNKSQDAAQQHAERILEIQADFMRKEREQQNQNEISKRQSQADFYDRLTSSELNKSSKNKAALQQIDSDYQSAYQKSQELAQSGNAKLAADYLALKQKQAEQELSYQEAVAKAAADKDTAEVGRLERIQQMRRDAAAEEERQLLAGGDANVTTRDQALSDEAAKYAEKQDQVALSSDRAADRKIANAERAGKAIDAEQIKLDKLAQTYDRVAPAPAGGLLPTNAATLAPVSTPTTAPAAATQAPAIGDLISSLLGKLDALQSALVSAERQGADQVAGAVRNLSGLVR